MWAIFLFFIFLEIEYHQGSPSSLISAWISAIFIILQPNGETHVGDFLFFIFLEIEYHQGWLNGVILG